MSTLEVNHNAEERTLEVSCRIFTDDFENALGKAFRTKASFYEPALKTKMDSLVKKYIQAHLQITSDGRRINLNYLGYEREEEAVYVYVEGMNVGSVKKMTVYNSVMHDLFDDQSNILHIIVNGNRKSTKLDYPTTSAVFDF